MKKRGKHKALIITLSVFGGVFALLGGTVLGFFINGQAPDYHEIPPAERSTWMNSIRDDVLLKDVVLPGSHDAMTNGMLYMAQCQNADMEESLRMGARYFDFRVNDVKGTLRIYHSVINGVKLEPVLVTALTFLQENPSETLVFDFQHFENDAELATYEMVHQVFPSDYLVNKENDSLSDLDYVASLTLSDVRGKALLLYGDYQPGDLPDSKSDLFPRDNDSCSRKTTACLSFYDENLHKGSSDAFIEKCLPEQFEIAREAKKEDRLALFVLQSQLTDGKFVFGPYAREKGHDRNMSLYVKSLADSENLSFANIIMRDFINVRKCGEIIRLNEPKGNVKDESSAAFHENYSSYA